MPAKLLIANRGEIAVRIHRAAAELGRRTVAVYSQDDAESLHRRMADESRALPKAGAAAYLDIDAILQAAKDTGCDAIHPGYGFLSENAEFARRCAEADLTFVGPRPELLALFGGQSRSPYPGRTARRAHSVRHCRPHQPVRGRRFLRRPARYRRHAHQGHRRRRWARHAGGAAPRGTGGRLCALPVGGAGGLRQRRRVRRSNSCRAPGTSRCRSSATAPGPSATWASAIAASSDATRNSSKSPRRPVCPTASASALVTAAITLAASVRYDNVGTFEFLVDASALRPESSFAFIEANPRLQVEHTVTEEVYGVDLVAVQLELASGRSLADLGPAADRRAGAARRRHPGAHQHGDDAGGRHHTAVRRHPQRLRARLRAGHSGGYVWLRRLHAQRTFRRAAGQAHRLPSVGPLRARRQPVATRAGGVPRRRAWR